MSITSDCNPMASLTPVNIHQPAADASFAISGLPVAEDNAAIPAVESSLPVRVSSADASAVLAVEGTLPAMAGVRLGSPIVVANASAAAALPGTLVTDASIPAGALPASMASSPAGNVSLPVIDPS